MQKIICSICGYSSDQETTVLCPECNSYVCEECSYLYNGYCKDCYKEVTLDFDDVQSFY